MARIRSVSPDLRTSETAAAWPREARYAWVLLWGYLDDYGRGLDNPKVIAADCFPLDDDVDADVMDAWLVQFQQAGAVCRYIQDGKRYLHCLNWSEYQKPQHPGKVRVPPCSEHEVDAHVRWEAAHTRPSGNPHESFVSASPTRGRGSKEMSKEVSRERSGGPSSGDTTPPRYPDHCPAHANVAVPGKCGDCKDARKAWEARPVLSVVASFPAKVPHCGNCDELRMRETPFGLIRCPECHPLAEEASA